MTTREALIAAIAANPDNDLPRLVAADWFEENGDPERAEFIRLQVHSWWHHEPQTPHASDSRAEKLLLHGFGRWFGPMLSALDASRSESDYLFIPVGKSVTFAPAQRSASSADFVERGIVHRGFVGVIELNPDSLPVQSDLGRALRDEPIETLSFPPSSLHNWPQFTVPELRRVRALTIGVRPLSAIETLFHDPHLAGVRSLSLWNRPLSGNLVIGLVNSPLGRQLTELTAPLDDHALRIMADGYTAPLNRLKLDSSVRVTADGLTALTAAPFARRLHALAVLGGVTNPGLIALSNGRQFAELTNLELFCGHVTRAGLEALAAAEFTPRLRELMLYVDGETFDPDTLWPLADALDPGVLNRFRVSGLNDDVAEVFTERFGDRVVFR